MLIMTIGINQNDIQERNHQVVQIRDVFSKAESVIAWLGRTISSDALAFLLISAKQRYRHHSNDSTRAALASLLSKTYWTRAWNIQEFLLPKKWWAGYCLKADDLYEVARAICDLGPNNYPRCPTIWNAPGWTLLLSRACYQMQSITGVAFTMTFTLWPLLVSFSTSKCTKLHNKIHGLLGIANDTMTSTEPIVPDYNKSTMEVLIDVLRNQRGREVSEGRWPQRWTATLLCLRQIFYQWRPYDTWAHRTGHLSPPSGSTRNITQA
jgi:hypothetical protein